MNKKTIISEHMSKLGKIGGPKTMSLKTKAQRIALAKKAAKARWSKK